MKQRSKARKAN